MRVVVGRWRQSPLGAFADVMLAEPDGTRVLLAPDEDVAEFVSTTYRFDRVEIGPVDVAVERGVWPPFVARRGAGTRHHASASGVVRRWAGCSGWCRGGWPQRRAWARLTDPVARVVLRGVRTRGSAGNGRREYYGATDLRRVTDLAGSWQGTDLGGLAPVSPEPGFGFGSTPRRPSVTSIVTTIDVG